MHKSEHTYCAYQDGIVRDSYLRCSPAGDGTIVVVRHIACMVGVGDDAPLKPMGGMARTYMDRSPNGGVGVYAMTATAWCRSGFGLW